MAESLELIITSKKQIDELEHEEGSDKIATNPCNGPPHTQQAGDKRKSLDDSPAEPLKKKIGFSMSMKSTKANLTDARSSAKVSTTSAESKTAAQPIKITLGSQKPKEGAPLLKKADAAVAQAFNDEDSDEEEMPAEARMRMRNIGRDTPTAAGPNSFGKNRLGFCDRQRLIQKQLQEKMDEIEKKD